jgi:hypothetical protein
VKRLRVYSLGLGLVLAPLLGCMAAIEGDELDDSLVGDTAELAAATYTFESHVAANRCLDVNGGFSANGTKIQSWECNKSGAQLFRVEDVGAGLSRLVNVPTSKCIDVANAATNDGARVQLHGCNNSAAQNFRIVDEGGGVVFVNPNSNKCLDVDGRGTANGATTHGRGPACEGRRSLLSELGLAARSRHSQQLQRDLPILREARR